jgi:SAM-dependent methyltransferase
MANVTKTHSSHAALNLGGRWPKAQKIHQLLAVKAETNSTMRLLEIGTGSGAIAYYFSRLEAPHFEVTAIDVEDQRTVRECYQFKVYDGRTVPFQDCAFDIVISNHVIEHVGDRIQQVTHLSEICRVLKPGGCAYLATPSRWQIMEPHFGLAFLSWLPRSMRNSYVRLMGKGSCYDCDPLRPAQLRRLLRTTGLPFQNINIKALHVLVSLERPHGITAFIAGIFPDFLLTIFRDCFPTSIYLIHKPSKPNTK